MLDERKQLGFRGASAAVAALINGRGYYNCSLVPPGAGVCVTAPTYVSYTFRFSAMLTLLFRYQFNVTQGARYRLRLINGAADSVMQFSIDNHPLTIIALDGFNVQPKQVDSVVLEIGQVALC